MKFKQLINRFISLLIAWSILLLTFGLLDQFFHTKIRLNVTIWLFSGLVVMIVKKLPVPLPSSQEPDIPGAFKLLWWTAWWPFFLVKGK